MKTLWINAGEISGDLQGGALLAALRDMAPHNSLRVVGMGGDNLARAGQENLLRVEELSVMGIVEVLAALPRAIRMLRRIRRDMERIRPDAVLLIDAPEFNFRVAKIAHRLGIPVYYFIPPKVWAWRTGRVKFLKKHIRRIFSILPFEVDFYHAHGCGLYARYRAFLWEDGALVPVAEPDCPRPEELLGYELQRGQVEANTRLLLAGRPANNVLLFGDGGTGKSATVKSMLYLPGMEDLRLIEIQKENLTGLPRLMRSLAGRRQEFILFIDDLAFDQDDKTYSSLKTILEGSLEKRPANTAIYATSNRRHLVRQNFSDRGSDEVDAAETIAEKTALAERFGLRIPYLTMNKTDYLALVDYLAAQEGIRIEPERLHAQAMTWEIRHAGRTPRVARQFIASLEH